MQMKLIDSESLSRASSHQTTTVYLRNCKGQARIATLPTPISCSDIAKEVSSRWKIPLSRLMLYYNGLRIDKYSAPINLVENSICHVIDTNNLNTPELQVTFQPPDKNAPPFKIAFLPETTIRQIIASELISRCEMPEEKIFLVYVGRTLNPSCTWREEMVEDGSEIQVMHHISSEEALKREAYDLNSSYQMISLKEMSTRQQSPVTFVASLKEFKRHKQQATALLQLHSGQSHQTNGKSSNPSNQNHQLTQNSLVAPQASPPNLNLPHPILLNQSFPSMLPTIVPTQRRDSQQINGGQTSENSQPSSGERGAPLSNPSRHEEQPAIKIMPMQSSPVIQQNPPEMTEQNEKEAKLVLQLESKTHKSYPQPVTEWPEPQKIEEQRESLDRESSAATEIKRPQG